MFSQVVLDVDEFTKLRRRHDHVETPADRPDTEDSRI